MINKKKIQNIIEDKLAKVRKRPVRIAALLYLFSKAVINAQNVIEKKMISPGMIK